MAPPDNIHETSEKMHTPSDGQKVEEKDMKPGSVEDSGEVFHEARYRALGW
jgi:hypothetical protein